MSHKTLAGFLILAGVVLAQEPRGSISGRVSDASGAVIPNAEVRAVNIATQAVAAGRTNAAGNYTIPYLLPGTYTLTVESPGFKKFQREGIQLRVDDSLEVNVQMTVGEVTETVEVAAGTPLLETTSSSLGQVVDGRRMTELPVQAGNAFELVLLAPGVINTTNLRLRKAAFNNAPSQLSLDGSAQYGGDFTIDGISNLFSNGTEPRVAFSPPQEAITEFKVQTASYDATASSNIINVQTKSGTNELHGEVHYWLTNSALDAQSLFQNKARQKRPVYQDNRWGGSAGGPVFLPRLYDGRNKTFFFYAYEGNKWGVPGTFVGTVPSEAQRTGDLSQLLARGGAYQIYDPSTIADAGGGRFSRRVIDGNRIAPSRIDSVAQNIMKSWPLPNQPGIAEGRNNFSTPTTGLEDYYVHLARADHNFSQNHRVFFRVHYDWWAEDKNHSYTPSNRAVGIILNRINRGLAFDDVVVLSPTTILNLRYGLTQQEFPERRRSQGFDLASLGFSPALVSLTLGKSLATFPRIVIGGNVTGGGINNGNYSSFGDWESGDGTNTSIIHNFRAGLTSLRGNHNLRYGFDYSVTREFGNRFPFEASPVLVYGTTWTRGPFDNSTAAPIGQDLASFLLGLPTDGEMRRTGSYAEQDQNFSLYLQDDWKLTRKLTLNLGLRYAYETPITERFNRSVAGFAFGTSSPIEAAARANYARSPILEIPVDQFRVQGGLTFVDENPRSPWSGERNNLMPRIGLAYQWNPKTVIRTGYGMFYDTIGAKRSSVIQTGFTQDTPLVSSLDNGLSFIASTANPFPRGLDPARGAAGGLLTSLARDLNAGGNIPAFFLGKRLQPYAQRWSFGVQRELPAGFIMDVSYVGNRGTRLPVLKQIDVTPPQYLSRSPERDQATIDFLSQQVGNPFFGLDRLYTRNVTRANLLRPYPQFGRIAVLEHQGYSWYHALQVRGEKRFSRGYTVQASYAWSKLMEAVDFLNESDLRPYEVISTLDRLHRFSLSSIFELPFGKGRRYASGIPGWADQIIGGWQINAVIQRQAGPPLNFAGGNPTPNAANLIFRGNLKDIPLPKDERSVDRWFSTNAGFERDSRRQLEYNIRTFPFRFSGIRADGQARWDFSAIKNFPIREQIKLQFRAEAYNAWNHPNLDGPNMNVTNANFGVITGQSPSPRQFQLALKLTF